MIYNAQIQLNKIKLNFYKERNMIDELVVIENNKAVTSSLKIAEVFEKNHKDVLRIINDKKQLFSERNFTPANYIDEQGKPRPLYYLDRDFASFIIMGFTGAKAEEWKLKYIAAFNKMESMLKEQNNKILPSTYKEALKQLLEQVEENEKLVEENKVLLPKAEYHDEVLNKEDLINTTTIAKDANLKSAAALNQILYLNQIIFKGSDCVWKPYSKYEWIISDGYADYRSYTVDHSKLSLQWTEKGRKWILENLSEWKKTI